MDYKTLQDKIFETIYSGMKQDAQRLTELLTLEQLVELNNQLDKVIAVIASNTVITPKESMLWTTLLTMQEIVKAQVLDAMLNEDAGEG